MYIKTWLLTRLSNWFILWYCGNSRWKCSRIKVLHNIFVVVIWSIFKNCVNFIQRKYTCKQYMKASRPAFTNLTPSDAISYVTYWGTVNISSVWESTVRFPVFTIKPYILFSINSTFGTVSCVWRNKTGSTSYEFCTHKRCLEICSISRCNTSNYFSTCRILCATEPLEANSVIWKRMILPQVGQQNLAPRLASYQE